KPGTIEYYERLKEELQERVAKKVPAVLPEEKYRLYWDNYIMWGWLGPLSRKIAAYGGNMIIGRYPYLMFPHPESLDPENPIYSVADQLMRWMLPQGLPQFARKLLGQFVEDFSLDGLIMLSSPTCRLFDLGQQDIIDEIERKYGIPGIIIEGDMVDPKFYSEAQLDTRLQALFEVIDGRRKMRRVSA
ncbi:MAG: 2-hydroxyacyl-CoA dehydratase, partial [Candidatus Tectomicrobia bacterium]|nr:2-hydroxyacyl-CoA dehydratase [Candidatus Tectomicrobia bacterium]